MGVGLMGSNALLNAQQSMTHLRMAPINAMTASASCWCTALEWYTLARHATGG
jgi:hypothetical protein